MIKKLTRAIATIALGMASCACFAQKDWKMVRSNADVSEDSVSKNGFTLIFINKDATFDHAVQQRMIDAFFTVYPKEVKTYNKKSLKKVHMIIDPEYDGVAATSDGIVRVNPEWMHKHPGDIDVVTHEVMHIVQDYPGGSGPGWITEGIADYVRYTLGVDNAGGDWRLPDYNARQSYKDAYRVTARFFVWLEKNYEKDLVKKLDKAMRTNTYTKGFWKKETGKNVDELWAAYAANPVIN